MGGLEEAVRNAGTFRLFDWSHLASFVAGVAASFLATVLWDWRTRPRVVLLGLERAETTFGVLRKIRFRLRGHASPGVCGMRLEWPRGDLFAKWDETPNPLEGDHLDRFRAELVPAAFYQPLFHHRDYVVPIIVERNGGHEVFSGWWVGRAAGYGPDPAIRDDEHIRVTITGAGLHWSRSLSVARLVGLG